MKVEVITPVFKQKIKLPLFRSKIAAGFPSPCDDHLESELDLNDYLIEHPAPTFFVRAKVDSMQQAGIFDNGLLIVDRSLTPKNNGVVIAAVAGELMVKRLYARSAALQMQGMWLQLYRQAAPRP
jgi:DNA polymerase V